MAQAVAKSDKPVHRVQAVSVHRPIEDRSFLSVIAAAAADPKCDVAKMQALLDMQRQVEDRESEKAFTQAFIALQEALPAIRRDGKIEIRAKDAKGERTGNVQQATPYATFNSIMKTIKPLLVQYGFLSYGKRYCTIALLNIVSEAPEDQDTDGFPGDFKHAKGGGLIEAAGPPPKISKKQREDLDGLLVWAGVPPARFCEKYNLTDVGDLQANLFPAAEKAIKDYKAEKDGAR